MDYSLKAGEGEDEGEVRRLPVGATAQIGQLASVLKQGFGVSPLKPRVCKYLKVSLIIGVSIVQTRMPMPVWFLVSAQECSSSGM